MQETKIALTAIRRGDEYVMHKRNGDKARGAVGLVGFVGGEFERRKDKSYLRAALRETGEETDLKVSIDRFRKIGTVNVISDRDNELIKVKAVAFELALPFDTEVVLADPRDELVIANTGEIIEEYLGQNRLTPATEAVFKRHIMKGVVYLGLIDN